MRSFIALFIVLVWPYCTVASSKSCTAILSERFWQVDARLAELSQSALSIALQGTGSYNSVLRHLRLLIQSTINKATDRVHANAALIAQERALVPLNFPKIPEYVPSTMDQPNWISRNLNWMTFGLVKSSPPISQTPMEAVVQSIHRLRTDFTRLSNEIRGISQAIQSTETIQIELQRDFELIQNFILWLTKKSASSRKMTKLFAIRLELTDFYIELNTQIAMLEGQVQFLSTQVEPLRKRRNALMDQKSEITEFFISRGPSYQYELMGQNREPLPDDAPRFPDFVRGASEKILESGFDRAYYYGDRLLQAVEHGGNWHFFYTSFERFEQRDGRKVSGYVRSFIDKSSAKDSKNVRFSTQVVNRNINETDAEKTNLVLARPGMRIDQYQLHQDLEVDLPRIFKEIPELKLGAKHPFESFFEFFKLTKTLSVIHDYSLRNDGYTPDPERLANILRVRADQLRPAIQSQISSTSNKRYFVKLLGTDPRTDSVTIALWIFDSLLSETGPLNVLKIKRTDLPYLKSYSDLSFRWPQFDHLDSPLFNPLEDTK